MRDYSPKRSSLDNGPNPILIDVGGIKIPITALQNLKIDSKDTRKEESTKKASWYYHLYADVEIPEICVYSISNRCSYENKGCKRLHSKCASQWQIYSDKHWYNMREFHSKVLEENFQDPKNDLVPLVPLKAHLLDSNSKGLLKVLRNYEWTADFNQMMLKYSSTSLQLRRLATHSNAISKSSMATIYEWYFIDEERNWIKFGQPNSRNEGNLVPDISSDSVEMHFCSTPNIPMNYQSSEHRYTLDFDRMVQINDATKTERKVKRRPKIRPIKGSFKVEINSSNSDLPLNWKRMGNTEIYQLVTLDPNSTEYSDVRSLFLPTLPRISIQKIERIQNPSLWTAFINKRNYLVKKYNSSVVSEKKLFHGTSAANIRPICEENLDWRLHGSNVGNIYGRGTYFSAR